MIPKAALFDLDGTLVTTEHRSRSAWSRLFRAHGLPVDDELLATFIGRRGKDTLTEHLHRFPGGTVDELFAEVIGYQTGPDSPPPYGVPGAAALVKSLHAQGVPMAVVTSGPRDHAGELLDLVGGAGLFMALIAAEDVSRGKPDPEGFTAACAALGVAPADAIAFEDAPAGIAAARATGLRCVAVTTTHPAAALAGADLVMPDLTEIDWTTLPQGIAW
ncbi:HAD family phosphatase [Streptomyces antimycoticus]|uniref:HAD family hydrolase n=1 Tax=Streptomyces antimycoticus TaxID=68175 RepID=UPI00341C4EE5